MSVVKKVDKSMPGVTIPLNISSILSLRSGVTSKNIPDELLQTVNSIKVRLNPSEWKSITKPAYSWRSGAKSSHDRHHTSTSVQTTTTTAQYNKKYVSKFKNVETTKLDDKILNNIINGKLNKFSPANYDEIKQFLEQILDSGQTDFVKDFMLLVFKKAAAEEIYCPSYARLLAELTTSYDSLRTEMILLQKSFMEIFEEIEETETADYSSFLERNQQKIYRLGYSQFLAELAHREIMDSDTLIRTLNTLLEQLMIHSKKEGKNKLIEEYCDCILRMTKIFKKKEGAYLQNLKNTINDAIVQKITNIIQNSAEYPSISKKAKFSLMDIVDILRVA